MLRTNTRTMSKKINFSKQEQEDFDFWIEDGNVSKDADGSYSTQDAQWQNSLKDMDALKEYYAKEFLSGTRYAGGGDTDDKHLIAKAIEYITGSAIESDTIQFEANNVAFKYKGKNVWSTLNKKLLDDTIRMHGKSLKGRFEKGGEAGFDDAGTSMVMYHEKKGNWLVPKGQVYLWLYDVEESAGKLSNEEFDYVFYPHASKYMGLSSSYIPPLKRIWTKKFQKDNKGSEHLLGVIKAFLLNDGKELYIDMMSVNPTKKKKGIMSYMIKELRDIFNLEQDQITFSDLTEDGKKFVAKKTYADGGMTIDEIDAKKKVLLDKVNKLIPVHKKKYGNIPIDSPKSEEEKESDKKISNLFSEINELISLKRKLLKEQGKFADGGDVPHEDKMFLLPLEMVVYVPSTQDVDKVISVDAMDKRVDEVKEYLASKFGGYSSADKLGGFVDSKGKLVNEDVVQVTSFSTQEAYDEYKEELIQQLAKWGKEWGQEAIGFEFEGDLMYVPQQFKNGGEADDFKKKDMTDESNFNGVEELISQALDESFTLLEKQVPKTKKSIKSISIIDVKPLELSSFMKKNNVPDDAFFDGRDNGYDAWDDILLSWDVDVPTSGKERSDFRRRRFTDIAFRKVYDSLKDKGYKRKGFDSSLLKQFKDTTLYDMYTNQEFDRILQYYSMYFVKE